MNRRSFMKHLGTGIGIATMTGALPATALPARRNVVLYVADDMGMNDAACYGNASVRTPGLDALAQEGVRFTHAFCTTASCSPSRSVLLTGLFNHANGQYGLAHNYHHFVSLPNVKSLPVLLGDAGYRTVCAGKFHVEPDSVYRFGEHMKGGDPKAMADACLPLLEDIEGPPFFLYFCPSEPHRPFHRDGSAPVDPAAVSVPAYLPDIAECREELAAYYGSIERCDSGLLRLIDLLRQTGRWEDTLVIFLSDNGAPFPGAKTTLYEPGTRLPCVMHNPFAERRGHLCGAMITWADIAPTILEFTGVYDAPDRFHGRSCLAAMEQEVPEGWDEINGSHTFHEVTMYYPMRSVRTRRHKLIWNLAYGLEYPFASDLWNSKTWQAVRDREITRYGMRSVEALLHRPRFELYDLESDPHESINLADNPEHHDLLHSLQTRLRAFQESTRDPWLLKWDRE